MAIEDASSGRQLETRNPEVRYHRFVRWSDEDQCYIGYFPRKEMLRTIPGLKTRR